MSDTRNTYIFESLTCNEESTLPLRDSSSSCIPSYITSSCTSPAKSSADECTFLSHQTNHADTLLPKHPSVASSFPQHGTTGINASSSTSSFCTPPGQFPSGHFPPVQLPPDFYTQSQQPAFIPPVINAAAPEKKKPIRRGFAAALITVCLLGSSIFGFGGTYLANYLNSQNGSSDQTTADASTVLYQSVLKTSSENGLADPMSIEDVVFNMKDSVVEITTETVATSGRMGQAIITGAGSGVIISKDGYIVTNAHVVSGAKTITVRLSDGKEYVATLIGTDSKSDLAVIKIDARNLQPAVFGNSSSLLVGQSVIAIGNPLGELGGTATTGIISALDREITIDGETRTLLQTDAAINPGNSGGGLFNLYGELVGIVNAKSSGSGVEGLGFAIPIDSTKEIIAEIIQYGYVRGRINTGLNLVDIQDSQTAMYYRVNQLGLYISESASNEFQSGDRITAVDGKEINSLADFNKQLDNYQVGDTINITVNRNGRSVTGSLTLTESRS